MTALLALYMVKQLLLPGHAEHVIGLAALRHLFEFRGPMSDQAFASLIYGWYGGLVYFTPLVGGWVADRWIGVKSDVEGSASVYCPPQEMKLDGRGYAKIALEEYQRRKGDYAGLKDFPLNVLALALLRGLQERYPCQAEAQSPTVKLQ
jgi:hypothetical protein